MIQPKPRPRVAAFVSPPPRPQPRAAWAGAFPDAPPPWAPLAVPAPVPPPTPSATDAWPQPHRRSSSFSHPTCKYYRTSAPAPPSFRVPVVVCLLCSQSFFSSVPLAQSRRVRRPRAALPVWVPPADMCLARPRAAPRGHTFGIVGSEVITPIRQFALPPAPQRTMSGRFSEKSLPAV